MTAREGVHRSRSVVVVDDDPVLRAVLLGALAEVGLNGVGAASGAEALELLSVGEVSALVVDLHMPGMSGIELTSRVRETGSQILAPLLFLSAEDSAETRLDALRGGATDFLVKSLPLEEIAARVKAHVEHSSRWRAVVDACQQRASTMTAIAGIAPDSVPAHAARLICDEVSRAHGGARTALFALTGADARPNLVAWAGGGQPALSFPAGHVSDSVGAWIHTEVAAGGTSPAWWACAPLQRGHSPLGILAVEGGLPSGRRPDLRQQLMAATADYAVAASLQLGPALQEAARDRDHRKAIEQMLSARAFHPVFQPVIDLRTDRVVGFEALARLDDGQPVLEMLTNAHQAGMRAEVELALVESALRASAQMDCSTWLSVNLSPSVVVDHCPQLIELLGSAPRQVVIELTENEPIDDYAVVREAVTCLGERVKLSVDDTGAGYASMRHVVDLHPQFLKLDRSWVVGLPDDDSRQAFIAGLVAFCARTGTEPIAEGIETDPELEVLRALGVTYGQGYHLGRPAPLKP